MKKIIWIVILSLIVGLFYVGFTATPVCADIDCSGTETPKIPPTEPLPSDTPELPTSTVVETPTITPDPTAPPKKEKTSHPTPSELPKTGKGDATAIPVYLVVLLIFGAVIFFARGMRKGWLK